jgi:hypothetical protein
MAFYSLAQFLYLYEVEPFYLSDGKSTNCIRSIGYVINTKLLGANWMLLHHSLQALLLLQHSEHY